MQIRSGGIDLGKTTFHVVALNAAGKVLLRKKFTLKQLITFTANMQTSLVGMEACSIARGGVAQRDFLPSATHSPEVHSYGVIRRAIMLDLVPVKNSRPRTRTLSPLVSVCGRPLRSVPLCQ
jgi:hypothetical protein